LLQKLVLCNKFDIRERTWWSLFQKLVVCHKFDISERTWWSLFQKLVVWYKFDICVFIKILMKGSSLFALFGFSGI
jgi:hypothetical protein